MKKNFLTAVLCLFCMLSFVTAQNVFNPNDPIVNFDAFNPPVIPPANTLAKWVRTPRSEVPFNTDRFKAYYYNGMAFRLRFPNNYNPADPTKKYPVILFFHGIGETGPATDNEIHLSWGAQFFESKINQGQFDAFLMFPITSVTDWTLSFNNINNVLDLLQQYCNADPDRLITMGLSMGADGTMKYTFSNPQRSAISIASSTGSVHEFTMDQGAFIHIPFWIATGGQDIFDTPAAVQPFVDRFTGAGGDIRWTLYPDKGHGVWVEHWNEPYLIPYWQAAHKANPLVFYKQTQFPPNTALNVKIGITGGYAQYQWQKDFVDMIGVASNEIIVNQPGTYRVRFRRSAGSDWSSWSPNPAVITQTGGGDHAAPSAPANLKLVSTSTSSVSLQWDNATDNIGVTGYDVFVNGVKKYSTAGLSLVADNLTANTSYTFTVQAHDLANNFSSFSNAIQGTTAAAISGSLSYKFYQGSFSALPDFSALTPVKSGTTSNIDIGVRTAGIDDNFAFLWEGNITINIPGNYTFETVSDDGSKLYFNTAYAAGATALVNNDGLHAASSASGTINLAAGTYPIAVAFFEQGGGESMQVYWSGPGISRQLIPASAFTGAIPPPANTGGLNYKYYEGSFTSLPDFNALTPVKTGSSANADISLRNAGVNDNFAFLWEGSINISTPGTYTFETVSDDGSRLYFNSNYSAGATALVNNDGLHPAISATGSVNIPATGAYPIAITFFEATGGEGMQVYWSGPGISRQLIPNSAFGSGTPAPTGSGLNYKYYEGAFTSLPNFSSLSPVKTGASSNVDLSVRTPGVNDNYAFVWEGNITLPSSGTYTFETVSDDGSKLYLNSLYSAGAVALVNNDGIHPAFSASGTVNIAAGTYPIAITFFEATGGENMQVYWSGPGIPRQLIPNAAFTGNSNIPVPSSGLNYKYFEGSFTSLPNFNSLSPVKTGTSSNVDITVRTPGVDDNFAFLWEGYINITTPGIYTFETVSDDGSKLYFNTAYSPGATALVNNDGLHPAISVTGSVNIPVAGSYPIAITYFEASGGENMQVYWSGPGIARQLIPNSAFSLTSAVAGAATLSQQSIIEPVADGTRSSEFSITQVYPNPFRESFIINFNNSSATNKIGVEMFDITGRLVYNQNVGTMAAGNTALKVDAGKQPGMPGVYFVRLNINGVASTMVKLMKRK